MSSKSYQKMISLMLIALVILLVAGTVTIMVGIRIPNADNWVQHTQKVQYSIAAFNSDFQSAEANARAYIITGDDSYLQSYDENVNNTGIDLQKVQDMTLDNPEQQNNIATVRPVLSKRLSEIAHGIETRREKGYNGILALLKVNRNKPIKQEQKQLSGTIAAMSNLEASLLEKRTAVLNQESKAVSKCVVFVIGVICIFLIVSLVIAWRGYNDAIRLEMMLTGLNKNADT